jgi:superfamily II DNA helicase RecQ
MQETLMQQGGHSVRTAQNVSGSGLVSSRPEVPYAVMKSFFNASELWWPVLQKGGNKLLEACRQTKPQGFSVQHNIQCGVGPSYSHTCPQQGSPSCVSAMLQTLVASPNFKSQQQESAVKHHFASPSKSFLLVLPTGGGKSLVFSAPVLDEVAHFGGVRGVTVVVSPPISLRNR